MTDLTQADRRAIDACYSEATGQWDDRKLYRAFARHHEQAEQETVAKIVAWLRNLKEMTERYIVYIETAQAANAIEAGEWK